VEFRVRTNAESQLERILDQLVKNRENLQKQVRDQ
jgi:hypothetical protein